jgi:hypothetical protein
MDIPIVEDETPNAETRLVELVNWAADDKAKLSAAFLAYEHEGENWADYLFQIGYIKNGCLVTTKKVIEENGDHCKEYKKWKEYMKIIFEIRCHLELYYKKIDSIPPWGTMQYSKLRSEGYTPRVLEGPHKVGKLRPNQKRKVILTASNDIVFGPLLQ